MKRISMMLLCLLIIIPSSVIFAYNTAGCMLHPINFNHPNLTQITWTAEISEYDYIPSEDNPFRIRLEFNSVGFMGNGTGYRYCYVKAMIQNVGHLFENDIVGSQFTDPPTIQWFPALGLYLSSLHFDWPDSYHGVELLADPEIYPQFARVFEDIDAYGHIGMNIYTRENVGLPSPENPFKVKWTVTKGEIVVNPEGNFSRNMDGDWVPLIGTFVIWNFKIEINDILYDVANYYLPIEKAEYIWAWDPLVLHQEYFGSAECILDAQKCYVKYTNMRAYDGNEWYGINDWELTWRIDDGAGNNDNRFGWRADSTSLYSRVGHEEDITECCRDIGHEFHITNTLDTPTNVAISSAGVITWNAVSGANSYIIYSSADPYATFPDDWTLDAIVSEATWTSPMTETKIFYCIVASSETAVLSKPAIVPKTEVQTENRYSEESS